MNKITFPLKRRMKGTDVGELQDALQLCLDRGALLANDERARREVSETLKRERVSETYGDATAKLVSVFQRERRLRVNGELDEPTADALNALLKGFVERPTQPAPPRLQGEAGYEVEGRVYSRVSAGVGDLRVVIVDVGVGGGAPLAQATTDDRGAYRAAFSDADVRRRGKAQPDLQAGVFAGDAFLGASEVRYNASPNETLNVLLDDTAASALKSEYEALRSGLVRHFTGRLGDLKETDEQQDITFLAHKTGWDARAVALAALADQFGTKTRGVDGAGAIDPAFFYALLRAGVGGNEKALYELDPNTTERIWKQAIEQGVIPSKLQGELPQAAARFHTLVTQRALEGPPVTGLSSLKEMLALSLGDDPAKQRQFVDLHVQHAGEPSKLWEAVRAALGEAAEKRLRIDGQLAYMTLNNAPLMRKLHAADPLSDTADLAKNGFYRAQKWRQLIAHDAVPREIAGADEEEKRSRYAEFLAAQVRLSFPTMVVAEMVRSGETPVERTARRESVHAFLTEHHRKFEIGAEPIKRYIVRNKLQVSDDVAGEITRIQRVYQITPSDAAMNALLRRGLDSAVAVSRYDRDQFVRMYKNDLGGEANARLTHAKAQQVHNAVFNIATSYLVARTAPQIGARSPSPYANTIPNADDIIPYATLESLFGEIDYCSCDHCRSVLSPAAYLVDLLHFMDRDDKDAWEELLKQLNLPAGSATPLQVLLDRRPDVQHLQLTCENTNVPLPYIDLVNETLEHYVGSNLSLSAYQGANTDGGVSPEELLASPQVVQGAAYTTTYDTVLKEALFPPPLPFHQPLETLRRYFDKFETPLPEVMEALRRNDDLERPGDLKSKEYGWRDILMEELRLSRAEYRVLTDHTLKIQELYGFAPATSENEALFGILNAGAPDEERFGLSYVKAFTRRVDISYEDIVEILKTRFVNPKLPQNGIVEKPIDGLITLADPDGQNDLCNFDKVQFRYYQSNTNGKPLPALEFVRLIRFIRVWKKLGWTIPETDKAIIALYPANPLPNSPNAPEGQKLDAGFLILLPRLGVLKRLMASLRLKPRRDLAPLLACFAPLDTHGQDSLYRKMFLAPAPAESANPFKEDGGGSYLSSGVTLDNVAERLRAAFLLTDAELNEIVADLKYAKATPLKLAEIGQIYRRGWLARRLKLSVRELLHLTHLTGIDPFAAPDPPDPASKHAGPPIVRLVDLVNRLRAASLKPEQALYLVWNQDLSGKSAPDQSEIQVFARTLRSAFAAIESEFARVDDPTGEIAHARMALVYGTDATTLFFGLLDNTFVTEVDYDHNGPALEQPILDAGLGRIAYDDFRKRLLFSGVTTTDHVQALQAAAGNNQEFKDAVSKVIGAKLVAGLYYENQKVVAPFFERYPELQPLQEPYTFFGELSDWVDYSQTSDALDVAILNAGENRIAYDPALKRLFFKGVMTEGVRDKLKAAGGGVLPAAVDKLFQQLDKRVAQFFSDFFVKYQVNLDQETYRAANDSREARCTLLLAAFLPELKRRRKRQQALQTVAATAGSELAFAAALLDNNLVLNPAAAGDNVQLEKLPALEDLTALETAGLSAEFFEGAAISGTPGASSEAESNFDYSPTGGAPLPFTTTSAIWTGYLEAPENGFYNFYIDAPGAVKLELKLAEKIVLLDANGANMTAVELRAGALYAINLRAENITQGLRVRWEKQGRGREVIPSRFLYSATLTDASRSTYIRFLKSVALASALKVTTAEIAYFAAHESYRIKQLGWLQRLPVSGSADEATSTALFRSVDALIDFALLKARFAPNDERLLTVLKDPISAADAKEDPKSPTGKADSLLFALTRWEDLSRVAVLERFTKSITDLSDVRTFRRVHDAFALLKKLAIPASALIDATTNEPTGVIVRNFKSALRARYDETEWLAVLRPINDVLRASQRGALVAYILQRMSWDPKARHINTPEKLFEYFLMDVQMDSCMQTSRVRHALSSVQLFIERCFLNLEPRVATEVFSPAHRKQWDWMKRYRVWEANRKIFLWPENWLEPELRDDQSPFFKEAMSELLQSDITEDRAATALLNYLSKLDEIAKLEPCGIHYVEGDIGTDDYTSHVVARTAGANRKYFYRRRNPGGWTPWEQIKLDIEENPVIPVVWKSRVFLFWLKILKQTPLGKQELKTGGAQKLQDLPPTAIKTDPPNVAVKAVLCWSEYYNGKWQQTKTSDINLPTQLGEYAADPSSDNAFNRYNLRLSTLTLDVHQNLAALRVSVKDPTSGDLSWAHPLSFFVLLNTHACPYRGEDDPFGVGLDRIQVIGPKQREVQGATIKYLTLKLINTPKPNEIDVDEDHLVQTTLPCDNAVPLHKLRDAWLAPFFYADNPHVFYVTPEISPVRTQDWGRYGRQAASTGKRSKVVIIPKTRLAGPPPPIRSGVFELGDAFTDHGSARSAFSNTLAQPGTIRYGGVDIGIGGRVNKGKRT